MTAIGVREGSFVPDLTLWHRWHAARGTLPDPWRGKDLPGVAAALGVPAWQPVRPWRPRLDGAVAETTESGSERITRWTVGGATLAARWVLGPDNDWWQAEYPVKSAGDLPAALALVEARRYETDPAGVAADSGHAPATGGGILAPIELPMRPYSELFHSFLGWTDGLMLLLEEPDGVRRLLDALEERLDGLVAAVAGLPCALVLSPDNLDGSFIPPAMFDEHLAPSYRRTADRLHAAGKRLVVHVGGMARGLLPGIARAGVDAVEGVCGAPQSDASLAEARAICGPGVTLWGGMAQDALLPATGEAAFEQAAAAALADACATGPAVLGVADRVPVEAVPDRLAALAGMARRG